MIDERTAVLERRIRRLPRGQRELFYLTWEKLLESRLAWVAREESRAKERRAPRDYAGERRRRAEERK